MGRESLALLSRSRAKLKRLRACEASVVLLQIRGPGIAPAQCCKKGASSWPPGGRRGGLVFPSPRGRCGEVGGLDEALSVTSNRFSATECAFALRCTTDSVAPSPGSPGASVNPGIYLRRTSRGGRSGVVLGGICRESSP
ncbi:hypothetical protein K402DRAFT_236622 [Aulographum hederae CBS 113979]|uniref:Uncharacterized protein n=1 Tax=Aulographum hederae CBS 113979 TaxID=1176131 RepID=A0A6G1GKU4_9PEZI|nr:hypothetical protein K402DRAFT_236622 [Aulographum hederae CBS 113979]